MRRLEVPAPGPSVPRRGSPLGRLLGRSVMRIAGWRFSGVIPDLSKAVIIVAPHTSNWDFVIGAAGMLALDLKLRFLAKDTVFRAPLGWLMRALGGIPVDRSRPGSGTTEALGALFHSSPSLFLALAPEGTRRHVSRWHTGFRRIALAGGVPIVPAALDYERRLIRLGTPYTPTGDLDLDLRELQGFFEGIRGRHPD